MIFDSLRNAPAPDKKRYMGIIVIIQNWTQESVKAVIRSLEQHAACHIRETSRYPQTWIIKSANNSRLVLTVGDPAIDAYSSDISAYWKAIKKAEIRITDIIGRVAHDTQRKDFLVYNTCSPIMLFTMPDWFWNCVRAVVMIGGLHISRHHTATTASTEATFTLSENLRYGKSFFDCINKQAQNKFPILHVAMAYSSSDSIRSLQHLPQFTSLWPALLHADVYTPMLKRGMDVLYTAIIRLAASRREYSGKVFAEKAKSLLEKHGEGKPWLDLAGKEESYTRDTCSQEWATKSAGNVVAAAGCAIDGVPDALAALIPELVPESEGEFVAARIVWRDSTTTAGGTGIKVALSGDSPQYMLLCLDAKAGRRVDRRVKNAFETFAQGVKMRAGSVRVNEDVAKSWKSFCRGTRGLVNMLVADDEKRSTGGHGQMLKLKESFRDGTMTAICKRSLA
ncbi:hypothetical protein BDV97DRAFT_108342 [Delphinella strobiligena]|nr:hypothetical protein BDV97DRAFT_108342 [Delphinella strobiligena]